MPKVSVIIPNYNHARFLEQRINSILNQTYQDFEIIYLDDASTDHSNEIFAQFADHPQMRSILNPSNSGSPFHQWNQGIQAANGDYIWIAESDDYADPKFLETLVPLLDNHPQVGLAYCQSYRTDTNGVVSGTLHHWTEDLDSSRWYGNFVSSGRDECKNYLVIKNTIPNASAVLIRKTGLEAIGYADTSMRLCGDWITWIKILLHADIAFSAQVLNYFRTHPSSVRSTSFLQGKNILERVQVFAFVQQHLEISTETAESIREEIMAEWVKLLGLRHSQVNWQRTFEFLQRAGACDPAIKSRFVKHFTAYIGQKIRHKFAPFASVKAANLP